VVAEPTLRELLTERMDAIERLMLERHTANKLALDLQAREYERRLEALNGEAERLRNMQVQFLPREVYESHYKSLQAAIQTNSEFRANIAGRQTIVTIVVSAVVSILVGLLAFAAKV